MSTEKLKILFYGDIISEGRDKNASRSGIYFVAYNLFRQFTMRDDLDLYLLITDEWKKAFIKQLIEEDFPGYDLKLVESYPDTVFHRNYTNCKNKRLFYKKNGSFFKKNFWAAIAIFFKIFSFPAAFFFKFTLRETISEFDVCFSPYHAFPDCCGKMKKFTILHDTIPLILPEYFQDRSNFLQMVNSINSRDFYFTVSRSTEKDFIKYCPQIDPAKITVTYLACNERFVPANDDEIKQVRAKYNIPDGKKYIFSLCTLEPRKNLIRAVKTFIEFIKKNNIDDLVFVLGGGHWAHFIGKLENEITDLGEYKDKIIRTGYIADEDVPILYSGAEWFVYTSQYEGFGLPPLEAMSCGCPVITSNNSSLPEVVGDAGIMIDFDSDEQHIKAYESYYYDSALRDEYSQKGLARAGTFSWAKCADIMIREIEKVI